MHPLVRGHDLHFYGDDPDPNHDDENGVLYCFELQKFHSPSAHDDDVGSSYELKSSETMKAIIWNTISVSQMQKYYFLSYFVFVAM